MKRSILCTLAFTLFLVCGCADNAKKAFEKGVLAFQNGNFDAAIVAYTEAIRLDPKNAEAYCNRSRAYARKGDFDKAFADCNEALRLDPKDAKAYYTRGVVCKKMGEKAKAEEDFAQAKKLGYKAP